MKKHHSKDFKECAVKNYEQGMLREEILKIFDISSDTLTRWVRQYRKTGDLSSKKGVYKARKINDELLLNYVKEHPDATLNEIAEEFSVCFQAIWARLKHLKITRKKKHFSM